VVVVSLPQVGAKGEEETSTASPLRGQALRGSPFSTIAGLNLSDP
jgi:hypothetical protein